MAPKTCGEKPNPSGAAAAAGPWQGLKGWEVSDRGVSARMKGKFPQAKILVGVKMFSFACPNVSHVG